LLPIKNGLKKGDVLSPLLFDFAVEYVIKRFQVEQDGLKLNGMHQFLVYADDVNILGESVRSVNKHSEMVSDKENGLEVNAAWHMAQPAAIYH
jgi:hypothetical protein